MPIDANGTWYPNIFPKQIQIYNDFHRYLLVSGPRKSGKCVDENTIIWASGRLVRIKDIAPTDLQPNETSPINEEVQSLGPQNNYITRSSASLIYKDTCSNGLRFKTKGGYSITTSHWHPIWSFCNGEFKYRTADEICALIQTGSDVHVPLVRKNIDWKDGDFLWSNFSLIRNNVGQKHPLHIQNFNIEINEDIAYMIGLLIGDGCLTESVMRACFVCFSTLDTELIESFSFCLSKYFDGETIKHANRCNYTIRSKKLRAFIRHLNLVKYAHEKEIPKIILESPKRIVRSFVSGLFDTDGSALKDGSIEWCSTSEKLAHDVHQILLAFGIRSKLVRRENKYRGSWNIYITSSNATEFYNEIGFRLKRKQAGLSRLPQPQREQQEYPDEIKALCKHIYLSRHSRGAERENLPRSRKHSGYDSMYRSGGKSVSTKRLWKFISFSEAKDDPELLKFFLGGMVFWEKIVSIKPIKVTLYDLVVPATQSFVGNGFINHNTLGCIHKVARHLWETPYPFARVGMFCKLMKTAKEGGVWDDLTKIVMPEWINSGIGMHYTTKDGAGTPGPRMDAQTKCIFFRVRNCYGGEAELRVYSLDVDAEVEAKVKSTRFSMAYFAELSNFKTRRVFASTVPQLRMFGLDRQYHQWIADTNPSEDGPESWIYKIWYEERLDADHPNKKFQSELSLIEVFNEDNPYFTDDDRDEIMALCRHDEELYLRYVKGLWVAGGLTERIFKNYFSRAKHVIGDASGMDQNQWQVAVPSDNCDSLITGWDPGEVNHAAVILEKVINYSTGDFYFVVLDELVWISAKRPLDEFTIEFHAKMKLLETHIGHDIQWSHYSDESAINRYRASAGNVDSVIIKAASSDEIDLVGVPKGPQSVMAGVKLIKHLLLKNQLYVSAHCLNTIKMLTELRKGLGAADYVQRTQVYKHVFDALRYALQMEAADAIMNPTKTPQASSRIVYAH